MRFMTLIKHPKDYEGQQVPPALYEAMGKFVEEYAKKGAFLDGAGLKPLTQATRVRLAGGKIRVGRPLRRGEGGCGGLRPV